jgi:hypothetical protein
MQNSENTQSNSTLHDFSSLNSKLKFTVEKDNEKLKILDVPLTNQSGQVEFHIYRKHILIDLFITNDFCHSSNTKEEVKIT